MHHTRIWIVAAAILILANGCTTFAQKKFSAVNNTQVASGQFPPVFGNLTLGVCPLQPSMGAKSFPLLETEYAAFAEYLRERGGFKDVVFPVKSDADVDVLLSVKYARQQETFFARNFFYSCFFIWLVDGVTAEDMVTFDMTMSFPKWPECPPLKLARRESATTLDRNPLFVLGEITYPIYHIAAMTPQGSIPREIAQDQSRHIAYQVLQEITAPASRFHEQLARLNDGNTPDIPSDKGPVVSIEMPEGGKTQRKIIDIVITIDAPEAVKSIEIKVNGETVKAIGDLDRSSKVRRTVSNISLAEGDNSIEVLGTTESGMRGSSKKVITCAAPPPVFHNPNRRQYALVIGINEYPNYPRLQNAVYDAQEVGRMLKTEYGFDEVRELYNSQATGANIQRGVEDILEVMKPGDDMLIFYSGHGDYNTTLNVGYWVPVDGKDNANLLPNSTIHDYVKAMDTKGAGHVLVIADSCFSGSLFSSFKTVVVEPCPQDASPSVLDNWITAMLRKQGRQCFTSGGNEPVPDGGGGSHSIFSRFLLDFLRKPPSPAFTLSELAAWVSTNVRHNTNPAQEPRFGPFLGAGPIQGEFVFVHGANKKR